MKTRRSTPGPILAEAARAVKPAAAYRVVGPSLENAAQNRYNKTVMGDERLKSSGSLDEDQPRRLGHVARPSDRCSWLDVGDRSGGGSALAEAGADVIVHGGAQHAAADRVAAEVQALGGR